MKPQSKTTAETEGGQVMLIISIFLLAGSFAIIGTLMVLVRSQIIVAHELSLSKASYILTEGALEDVVYRHKKALSVSATESLTEGDITVQTTTTNTPDGKIVLSVGNENGRIRKMETVLIEGDGAAFSFGVQTDNGGIILENNSSIDGNVYSNGSVTGSGLNLIKGTAISAGPSGYITEVHATGSAYAHIIDSSRIDDDAFYTSIDIGTVVNGTKYPGFPDLATSSLPIPDTLIDSWAAFAESSNILTAECVASGGHLVIDYDITLGPAKIPCDVTFEKFPDITISGVLWIVGDLEITQGPKFTIDPAIGNKSVPILVDDPANRLTSGRIIMSNSGVWTGNGSRSYLMLLSRNESAEQGGTEKAIILQNSNGGALLVYAGHGEINLQNNTDLTEITAYRVRLQNNTEVVYDTGLASAVFIAGPGGSYVIDSWQEVQ
ncbi:TPA: hypothetical protein DEP58_00485 [Patescibacteria group bacterium]|nr:MAG: hypothetical protein UU98_C0026G0017 [Parcubacteria group bacterium GW2011_GWD2_42_14]HCC04765.1 hypothetical protein [Patescibacteria group bacterium]